MRPTWLERYQTYRDSFLPEELRAGPHASENRATRWRTRRLLSLLMVIQASALLSGLFQVLQGHLLVGLVVAASGALVGLLPVLVRRGTRVEVLGFGLAFVGALFAAMLAAASGREGVFSLMWTGLAPLIALAVGGPAVALRILVATACLDGLALFAIYRQWVPVLLSVQDEPGGHLVGLLGAVVSYFVIVRVYETELMTNLRELEATNAALVEARQSAEAAARAKSGFLATMSHEIRTPMNGVLGMTTVMLAEELPPKVRDGLKLIQQSGDALLAILDDVLDYSKIEAGRLQLELLPVDLRELLDVTAQLFTETAHERHVTLVVTVGPEVPPAVEADPTRLRQVLLNLVSNAVKFSSGGTVRLTARATDASTLQLSVSDQGIGMSAQTLATLFEPFTQGDASTTRRFGGTGLGLAISRRLVAAMGGTVEASSTPGVGSTFVVTLPLKAAPPRPAASERLAPGPQSGGLTVLLVEDHVINRTVATRLLEQLGHRVVCAEDGAQALERLADASTPVDLVLMDCHMPNLDGFEATRRLRATPALARLPVVALTASTMPEETARCFSCGMDEVLHKPVRREALERVLRRFRPGYQPTPAHGVPVEKPAG